MIMILVVFILSSLVITWMFIGYPIALFMISRVHPHPIARRPQNLKVTILVCTFKEASVIERRIENLLESDYPLDQMEILIVDSASPDGTTDLVEKFCTAHPLAPIQLIREDIRRGKVSAINIGLSLAQGEIIILTDAPAIFWPDSIRLVVENFSDSSVGAVTGNFVDYPNGVETSAQKDDQLMFRFRKILRHLESEVDSTPWLSGELLAFRKSLLPIIPSDVVIDDIYIALWIRSQRYRVIADSRAKYAERRSRTYKEMIIQKVKSVTADIIELRRFRNLCFNYRYGIYGWLIFPTKLILILHFSPIFFALAFCSGILLTAIWIGMQNFFILTGFLGILVIGSSFYHKGKLLRPLIAFILAEWIITKGLITYVKGGYSPAWEQVRSTRE